MSGGQLTFGLVLVGLAWVSAYFVSRSPPRSRFQQYRESPTFGPKSRVAAAMIATLFAAVAALVVFAGRL